MIRIVERVRSKESEGKKSRKREWLTVRGALHLALAKRGSRVALYGVFPHATGYFAVVSLTAGNGFSSPNMVGISSATVG